MWSNINKEFCFLVSLLEKKFSLWYSWETLRQHGETKRFAVYLVHWKMGFLFCIIYFQIGLLSSESIGKRIFSLIFLRQCEATWGNKEVCCPVSLLENVFSLWYSSTPTSPFLLCWTLVLSESSPKGVLLLLFPELLAQPGRACLLCFTPEFDKVLVSLANRCLGLVFVKSECDQPKADLLCCPTLLHVCWGNRANHLFGCPVSHPFI